MNIQYIHNNKNRGNGFKSTVCLELPDYYLLEHEVVKTITDNEYTGYVTIHIGVARCHKEDQYVKSIGRDIATSNMEPIEMYINNIGFVDGLNEVTVRLKSEEGHYCVLVLKKEHRTVRALKAGIGFTLSV